MAQGLPDAVKLALQLIHHAGQLAAFGDQTRDDKIIPASGDSQMW
jgi:hypothetical protein